MLCVPTPCCGYLFDYMGDKNKIEFEYKPKGCAVG